MSLLRSRRTETRLNGGGSMTEPRPDILNSDHKRGCQGREYVCNCGYDDAKDQCVERMYGALVLIGRLAEACRSDMQGRLQDDEHHRAFRILGAITDRVRDGLKRVS